MMNTGELSSPAAPAAPEFSLGRGARFVRGALGMMLTFLALAVSLWAAAKFLESLLMGIVWIKQTAGGVDGLREADLFAGSEDLPALGGASSARPSIFALQALGALALSLLGFAASWGLMRLRKWALRHIVETSLSRFISARYLLSREHKALVSLITIISVLGIATGVTALIVVISVIEGFDRILVERTMGIFSHIEVWPYYSDESIDNYKEIIERTQKIPGIEGVSAIINQQTFFSAAAGIERDRVGGVLRGLDPRVEPSVTNISGNIISGVGTPGDQEVVLGSEMARRLRLHPGDSLYIIGKVARTASGPMPKLTRAKVVGVYKSGLYDIDAGVAYATLGTVQRLFVMGESVSAVHAKIRDPHDSFRVAGELQKVLGSRYRVRAWQQINPQFFEAIRMEKMVMFIILLLIVLVAAFNIIGTLIMVVMQKTREIGILKSMGATRADILKIFLLHGVIVGLLGTGLGLALGLRLCWFVEHHIEKIYQLPGNVYYGLDRLPVVVNPWTVGLILACSLAICAAAAVVPAFQASRLNPVEALRYE